MPTQIAPKTTDSIRRFIFDDTDIRGEILTLHSSFQRAFSHQQCPDILKPLFGEFLAAIALLSEILKFDGLITLQARGNGLLPLIMTEATHSGDVRGIISFTGEQKELIGEHGELKTLPELVGNGVLVITIDPNIGKRYQGIVPLDADNLAMCLSHYFSQSEQLPTYLKLHADSESCGGLFLQSLPAQLIQDEDQREDLWQTAIHLGATLSSKELFDLSNEDVLLRLFHDQKCRIFEPKNIQFNCGCTYERCSNAVTSLGEKDAFELLAEEGVISTNCQFCGKEYAFGEKELNTLFEGQKKPH